MVDAREESVLVKVYRALVGLVQQHLSCIIVDNCVERQSSVFESLFRPCKVRVNDPLLSQWRKIFEIGISCEINCVSNDIDGPIFMNELCQHLSGNVQRLHEGMIPHPRQVEKILWRVARTHVAG